MLHARRRQQLPVTTIEGLILNKLNDLVVD
jgi:hypothetical protein